MEGFVMRRLMQRKSRLIALTLMLALGGFVFALAGAKRFERTVQGREQTAAAGITINSTLAHPQAFAGVGRPGEPDVSDVEDAGVDTTWRTSYDEVLSAQAAKAGASATASGDLHASAMLNGDQLQYTSSATGKGAFASNGCNACTGSGSYSADLDFTFTVTQNSQVSLTGSISGNAGSGPSFAHLAFSGGGVNETLRFDRKATHPTKHLNLSKSRIIAPGRYSIDLGVSSLTNSNSSGSETNVAGSITITIIPANEF